MSAVARSIPLIQINAYQVNMLELENRYTHKIIKIGIRP